MLTYPAVYRLIHQHSRSVEYVETTQAGSLSYFLRLEA